MSCSKTSKKLCDDDNCEMCKNKSFASHEKAIFWSGKNMLNSRQVFIGTADKYIFNCECGHELLISPNNINSGSWCSYCSNPPKKLCDDDKCEHCKTNSFKSHEKSDYWSELNEESPRKVFRSSHKKYWFKCETCSHNFETVISSISKVNGVWCPFCAKYNTKLCDNEKCDMCKQKSFESSPMALFWSKKNIVSSRSVTICSGEKYWFDCNICNHSFNASLDKIKIGRFCPYCSNDKLCIDECDVCFEKSFSSNNLDKYWSKENKTLPRNEFKQSNKKFKFECIMCEHNFDRQLSSVTRSGNICPYCVIPSKLLCPDISCEACRIRSFQSSDKLFYWSEKNKITPREVFKFCNNKYWFNCVNGHEFTKCLNDVSSGGWCPYCVNKTEQKLYDALLHHYPQITQQFKVEWCKNKTYLPFDFVLEENKIIIELDGLQHFEQVSNWSSPEETHLNDVYKMKCANENGYSVIRILQEDVFYDTYDWLTELRENTEKIKLEQRVQNVYMGKDNEYSIFS